MKHLTILPALLFAFGTVSCPAQTSTETAFPVSKYNVVWDSPGKTAADSMPAGNGDLGANVYSVENDALYLLLGKTDAFDWNGNVLKTGKIRIRLHPNPFRTGKGKITQTLNLEQGCIDIHSLIRPISPASTGWKHQIHIRIWVDANAPVYRAEITSDENFDIRVEPEFRERLDGTTDTLSAEGNRLVWFYTNGERSAFSRDLAYYNITEMSETHPDPYQYNTFGCALQVNGQGSGQSSGLVPKNNGFNGHGKSFSVEIASLTQQTKDVNKWKKDCCALLDSYSRENAWEKHCAWWKAFWNRSWIAASDNTLPENEREKNTPPAKPGQRSEKDGGFIVSQAYNVSRYMMACQGRGKYQTQFNGGIFTFPFGENHLHPDERLWGNRFTFQNQRLLYWYMLAAGDTEMMRPFFRYYFSILDLRKAITKDWFGHGGAYWRENTQLTGMEIGDEDQIQGLIFAKPPKPEKGKPLPPGWYNNYYFNSGLEMAAMALEYYRFTEDEKFKNDILLPLCRENMTFYAEHYESDKKGKLLLEPAQVLETWWQATNPLPDIAGLHYLTAGLLQIPDLPPQDKTFYETLQKQLPDIPFGEEKGKKFLKPADKYAKKGNMENGELYAVFPYSLFGVSFGTEDIVTETMERRIHKNRYGYSCWTQDQIHFACAGMGEEAADGLIHRWSTYDERVRFPFFGKERPDAVPDFDHNGAGCIALQKMLVQENASGKIYLLPAWTAAWDVSFKLYLRHNTVIQGCVKNGKLKSWSITPEHRRKDVIISKNYAD
jgi:hypothetical protein